MTLLDLLPLLVVWCAILTAGLAVAALAQLGLNQKVCRTLDTQVSQGSVVSDLALNVADLEHWRNGLPQPPPPDRTPANHTHVPYVYHAEETYQTLSDGVGLDGLPALVQVPVGVEEHHACRLCSVLLD